jgi:hypothetical protein
MYQFFSTVPERARRFGNAMRSFTEGTGFELSHIADGFPWATLGKGTVVDVSARRPSAPQPSSLISWLRI